MARKFGIEIEVIGGTVSARETARLITAAGIECNVESYNHHNNAAAWKIVGDGSLSGRNAFEIVSPILNGDAGFRQVKTVATVIRNAGINVNRSCGLHVHVDARDLQPEQFKNVAKLVAIHESHMKRVLPESRHSNSYAAFPSTQFPGNTVEQIVAKIDAVDGFRGLAGLWGHERYRAVNFEAFSRHGTIEFRAHSGTVDAEKMMSWAALCVGLVRRAVVSEKVAIRWENGRKRNWQDFIRGAGKEHAAYFLKRWEELGGNTTKVYKSREARAAQLAKKSNTEENV